MRKRNTAANRIQAIKPVRPAYSVWAVYRTRLHQRQSARNELQDGQREREYLAQYRRAGGTGRNPR